MVAAIIFLAYVLHLVLNGRHKAEMTAIAAAHEQLQSEDGKPDDGAKFRGVEGWSYRYARNG